LSTSWCLEKAMSIQNCESARASTQQACNDIARNKEWPDRFANVKRPAWAAMGRQHQNAAYTVTTLEGKVESTRVRAQSSRARAMSQVAQDPLGLRFWAPRISHSYPAILLRDTAGDSESHLFPTSPFLFSFFSSSTTEGLFSSPRPRFHLLC
jgi:hypothetical protein